MDFGQQLKRIRRFLRDPDAVIWSRALLRSLFNSVQRAVQQEVPVLEDVVALRPVPAYHFSYIHDWEWPYLPSSQSQFYQALRYQQQGDFTFCHRFEAQTGFGDATDEGYHFSHPWEAFISGTPGEPVRLKFPSNMLSIKFLAFDYDKLEFVEKKDIALNDTSYVSRMGTPISYYVDDEVDNTFIPYPLITSPVWNDDVEIPFDYDFSYSYSWESSYATGERFTKTDSTNIRSYVFTWEDATMTGQDEYAHGMWMFEVGYSPGGSVVYVSSDTTSIEFGQLTSRSGSVDTEDYGVVVDVVDAVDNYLLLYDYNPSEIVTDNDTSDFHPFFRKYIDFGVISRAYQANTDGNIKSLSDYWSARYSAGLEVMKQYKTMRRVDRDYRLGAFVSPRGKRHPRLPSGYPSV